MAEKKPTGSDQSEDKLSKGDDQFNVNGQFGEDNQAIRDREVLADKQALTDQEAFPDKQVLADTQADISMVLPKPFDPVIGESWSNIANLGESGQVAIQSEETPQQSAGSLDDTESQVGRMVAAADTAQELSATIWTGADGVTVQPGLDTVVAGIGPADDGTIHDPDRYTPGDQVAQPGGVVVNWNPGGSVDAPGTVITQGVPFHFFVPLMDQRYVLEPVAIALGGGGSVGDFELGALDFIYTEFLGSDQGAALGFSRPRFDIATGTSVGAVNAGALAQGAAGSMEELKKIWFDMRTSDNFYVLNEAIQKFLGNQEDDAFKAAGQIFHNIIFSGQEYSHLATQTSIMNPAPLATKCERIERYWSPAGPGLRGTGLSVARDLQGHRIIFARGYDDMLYVRSQLDANPISASTQWSSWRSLGGPISSDPVAFSTGFFPAPADNPVRVGVIARLANEKQYGGRTLDNFDDARHVASDNPHYDPFQPWVDVPPPPIPDQSYSSQPTIIQRAPDGRAWAFCRDSARRDELSSGLSHRSFFSRWDGESWGNWTLFGQDWLNFAGNITGCSYFDGEETLELFTRDRQGQIMHNFTRGGSAPGNWEGWDADATSDLLVVLAEELGYMVDVFWRGTDGQVWTRRKGADRAWGNERPLGGMITSNLCYGRTSSGTFTIFARGLDDKLYELRQASVNGDWPANAWNQVGSGSPPGLTLLADPYTLAATPTSGILTEEIEVYVVASDHSVWTIRQQRDGTYTGWVSLGGKVWTGMKLRMCVVALEDGQVRYVEEAGRFLDDAGKFAQTPDGTFEPIISNDGDIALARAHGAIASCSAPAVFPAVPLNGRSWVDGGIRHGVPIGAAIVAGATKVIAIATVPHQISSVARLLPPALPSLLNPSPPPSLEDFIKTSVGQPPEHQMVINYSKAGLIDVLARSFIELLVDATSWSELYPPTPWPVQVWNIQQTFKTHEGGAIDPGLIRINYAYGWMRAFDILMASPEERQAAIESTDRIIKARWGAWKAEMVFREAYLIATWQEASARASLGTGHGGDDFEFDQTRGAVALAVQCLRASRRFKRELATALSERRDTLGLPLDPESPGWLSQFEMYAPPGHWTAQWKSQLGVFESPFWDSKSPFSQLAILGLGNNVRSVEAEAIPTL